MKKNMIFLGPPGAGKGTFASLLIQELNLVHISTGDILRNEIKSNTELGAKAKDYVESGGLVPDEIVAQMVSKRLSEPDCVNGFILDGFPRTLNQAKLLEDCLEEINMSIDTVIYFSADDELLLKRLTSRVTCKNCGENFNVLYSPPKKEGICDKCGGELYQRKDDSMETAKDRLSTYKEQTEPLVEYYKKNGLLYTLDAAREKQEIFNEIVEYIKE